MIREEEISQRLASVMDGHPWVFNPKHEMFVGCTNALEMYSQHLDLGRNMETWEPSCDSAVRGYKLSDASKRNMAQIQALGEFLANCREDIEYLLNAPTTPK